MLNGDREAYLNAVKEMKPNVYTVTEYTHSEEAELMKDGEKVILDYYEVKIGKKE